ncbi:putative peptidoglycan binding domain protein (plasmid) [Clostridium baratii str. Sullivan]|uniref:Putative peptidoglycan binding domain protein n=1 Tax=Clostridium baratii str. Sullivan TaxID=1415775 RepID=A0A0A7G0I6_9CLOT|nr:peptidoglycan-binding domain-containing protein [Clostridium baratii]AIY85353.1 putative peptidoglycan binding domain protein [Clostridium baratii str. Sullivan]
MYKLDIDNPMNGSEIYLIKKRLEFLGYLNEVNNDIYDNDTKAAIKKYQSDNKISVTGAVDNDTYNLLFKEISIANVDVSNFSLLRSGDQQQQEEEKFFDESKSDLFRKGNLEIKIKYGKGQVITLQKVKLYNKDQMIDSNGEPIYDVYQFIAQDIKE